MMNDSEKNEICKIQAFDYFNLFDKESLLSWLDKKYLEIGDNIYIFGNLNNYQNRRVLYNKISESLKIDIRERTHGISNLEDIFTMYTNRYLKGVDTILDLGKNISFFTANVEFEELDQIDDSLYKDIWTLREFAEVQYRDISEYENDVKRVCREINKRMNNDT